MTFQLQLTSLQPKDSTTPEAVARAPSETGDQEAPGRDERLVTYAEDTATEEVETVMNSTSDKDAKSKKSSKGTEPFERRDRDEMEKLLGEVCGHLGMYFEWYFE